MISFDKMYAVFDEHNDEMISIGLFDTEVDAEIAACEHGLTTEGVEWYVCPVGYDKDSDTYYAHDPDGVAGSCAQCNRNFSGNDFIWDGKCFSCTTGEPA